MTIHFLTLLAAFISITPSIASSFEGEFEVRLDNHRVGQPPTHYLCKGERQWVTTHGPLGLQATRIFTDFRERYMGFVFEADKAFVIRAMRPDTPTPAETGTTFRIGADETVIGGHPAVEAIEERPDGTRRRWWINTTLGTPPSTAFHPMTRSLPPGLLSLFPKASVFPVKAEKFDGNDWHVLFELIQIRPREVSDSEMEPPEGHRPEIVGLGQIRGTTP